MHAFLRFLPTGCTSWSVSSSRLLPIDGGGRAWLCTQAQLHCSDGCDDRRIVVDDSGLQN